MKWAETVAVVLTCMAGILVFCGVFLLLMALILDAFGAGLSYETVGKFFGVVFVGATLLLVSAPFWLLSSMGEK
jgi:hypothetical protein